MRTDSFSSVLARLRTEAQLSQAQLATRLNVDQSTVSRIEKTEDHNSNAAELSRVLDAIGTDSAREYGDFLSHPWSELERPSFWNPSWRVLKQADSALARIKDYVAQPSAPVVLKTQASLLGSHLRAEAQFLSVLTHSVAFVGDIGVGKTTALSYLADLLLPASEGARRSALETGAGRTTICEVQVLQGPQMGLVVEPYSDDEIYRYVAEFAGELASEPGAPRTPDSEERGVSREVSRALRNMTGLASRREKDQSGKTASVDPARELAKLQSPDVLRASIAARLNLEARNKRQVFCEPGQSWDDQLRWLRDTFSAINNGRHPDFSLPRRIDVIVSRTPFSAGELAINIIDTRGVDQSAIRPDIQRWLDDTRAITVLCTPFNSAPSTSVREFIEYLVETGSERALRERVLMLVLPRSGEAVAAKHDDGASAETDVEGYEIKEDQIREALTSIRAPHVPVLFLNATSDDPRKIRDRIVDRLGDLRQARERRMIELAYEAERSLVNEKEQYLLVAQREIAKRLAVFARTQAILPPRRRRAEQSLDDGLNSVHQRTLWASVRRRGAWENFDFYFYIGAGVLKDAHQRSTPVLHGLQAVIENALNDSDLEPSHGLLRQLQERVIEWGSSFTAEVRKRGEQLFRPRLDDASDLWSECEGAYGKPELGGFRNIVRKQVKGWFGSDAQQDLHAQIEKDIQDAWDRHVRAPLTSLAEAG